MGQRGKKSGAELSVAPSSVTQVIERPGPFRCLTDEQKMHWVRIVNALPADWFTPENVDNLTQYVRHITHSNRVEQLIQNYYEDPEFSIETLDRLYKMQERESRVLANLGSKMRLPQSAVHSPRKGKGKQTQIERPWKNDQDE